MARQPPLEWAILQVTNGSDTFVLKEGLRSLEEADAWLTALRITQQREDHERFIRTSGMVVRGEMEICWREPSPWVPIKNQPPPR